jgi:translation initiation factor SUI1
MGTEDYFHIQIQQRNGRKTLIQSLRDDYVKRKRHLRHFACNGTLIVHLEYGEYFS